jgi:hypothetical protein
MEGFLNFPSTLEFCSRLLNCRIARESLQQNKRFAVGSTFLRFASNREHRCNLVQLKRTGLPPCRDVYQFGHFPIVATGVF